MGLQDDWIVRQTEIMLQIIAKMVFQKDVVEYEIKDVANLSATDLLHNRLRELLSQSKICEAEDLLFEQFDADNDEFVKLAVDFYQTVNQMTDMELEANNFSREEINDGLREILDRCEISLPGL